MPAACTQSRCVARFCRRLAFGFGVSGLVTSASAAGPVVDYTELRQWVDQNQHAIVEELVDFLSIPNVATDTENIHRNAEHLRAMLEARDVEVELIETGNAPLVFGELDVPDAERTILFYCHYDGQPVDPAKWQGHAPFEPALRKGMLGEAPEIVRFPRTGTDYGDDWRIYARGASDDKGPIVGLLAALDGLRAQGLAPASDLKFVFEGDEERGSPFLAATLASNSARLSADLAVFSDGPVHTSNRPTIGFGMRGIATAQVVVYGPSQPLHSGHYGNWAPNPAERLAELVAGMQDERGRVTIEGWYADVEPLGGAERRALAELGDDIAEQRRLLVPEPEGDGSRWRRVTEPSLNLRGIRSGWTGEQARTIIPSQAVTDFDLRLVAGIEPSDQLNRFVRYIRRQGYHVVHESPSSELRWQHPRLARVSTEVGYPAVRTPMDDPQARALIDNVRSAVDEELVLIPTYGGSLPGYLFPQELGADFVVLPIVNPDNNQHAPNENLRLGHLFDGIVSLAAAMRTGLPADE